MTARLTVAFAGPHVTVQDGGRPGLARFGVPRSGAMDRLALAAANLAVGNAPGTAAIEVSLGGLQLDCVGGPISFAVARGGFIVEHGGQKGGSWQVATLQPGERLVLDNHAHQSDPGSPYRASGPIFVREAAAEAGSSEGTAPQMLAKRPLSLRVYDRRNMMIEGEVIDGRSLDSRLATWFDHPATDQVHIHFAPRGCYLARAVRV